MKKICFIAVDMTVIGGAETVTFELAEKFSDIYEVHVLGIKSINLSPAYIFSDKINYECLNVKSVRFREMVKHSFSGMKSYLKKNKFDVVFMEGTVAGFNVLPHIPFFRRTKFVFCDHGALINEWNDKEITLMRRMVSVFAHKTVVLTERSQKDYIDKFHLSNKKVCCIPNWISERFEKAASDYNNDSERIISVGRFGKEKGYDMAIEVAKIVFAKHPNWKWDFYGAGETFSAVQKKVDEYNLEKNVILHGSVNDTSRIYANHALLVLPSYREGLPLVLLEAKVNHLPCVSFDILTGPREIIRDNVNGFLVPMYDIEEMAKKVCELIENRELREVFSRKSALDIDKFEKSKIEEQWIRIIEN